MGAVPGSAWASIEQFQATPPVVQRAATTVGAHVALWRRMQDLIAARVAERADISCDTLRRLEHGDPGVSMATVLGVLRALGTLDRLVEPLDPLQTDLGRARAVEAVPKRVRRHTSTGVGWLITRVTALAG